MGRLSMNARSGSVKAACATVSTRRSARRRVAKRSCSWREPSWYIGTSIITGLLVQVDGGDSCRVRRSVFVQAALDEGAGRVPVVGAEGAGVHDGLGGG